MTWQYVYIYTDWDFLTSHVILWAICFSIFNSANQVQNECIWSRSGLWWVPINLMNLCQGISEALPDEFVLGNIPKLLCLVHRDFRHCLMTYTPKISLIILLTVCHKVLLMLDRRIFYWIIYNWCNPQIDIFLKVCSHLFSFFSDIVFIW